METQEIIAGMNGRLMALNGAVFALIRSHPEKELLETLLTQQMARIQVAGEITATTNAELRKWTSESFELAMEACIKAARER